ncbi:hypothetical protein J4462_03205 [Candidatus Pacearchaeota archaeon]|nr:hypothetical protein [Candidatus Pacearchaeota archaeon]
MNINKENIRSVIVQGYVGMLFLLIIMTLSDLTVAGLSKNLDLLQNDPGIIGLWMTAVLLSINVLIQIAIRTFDSKKFRQSIYVISIIYMLLFVAHQIFHFVAGDGVTIDLIYDTTHHIIGVWVIIYAHKWAKLKE